MNANETGPFPARPMPRRDPYEILAATLTDLLQSPIERTLRQLNAELDAHPMTRGMRLRRRNSKWKGVKPGMRGSY